MRLKYQKHKVFSEKFLIIENKNVQFTHAQVLNAYHLVCTNKNDIGLQRYSNWIESCTRLFVEKNQIARRLMMFSHLQKVAYMLSSIGGIKPVNLL